MPKVDRQGAKVRSTPAFMTFCGGKSTDAQQQSSNRRIAGSQNPKAEESGALSIDNISFGSLTRKTHQTELLGL